MKYKVFWKGECLGEFSVSEIEDRLSRGALGLLHTVELKTGRRIELSEFLSNKEFDSDSFNNGKLEFKEFDLSIFGFVLAGMSFLSVYVYLVAIIYCGFLLQSGRRNFCFTIFIVSTIIALSGYFFFSELIADI